MSNENWLLGNETKVQLGSRDHTKIQPIRLAGWLTLIGLQAIYLSMEVTEVKSRKAVFGIVAAVAMIVFGIMVLITSTVKSFEKHYWHWHHTAEGVMYVGFGLTLLILRLKAMEKEEKEEEEEEEELAKFRNEIDTLQAATGPPGF